MVDLNWKEEKPRASPPVDEDKVMTKLSDSERGISDPKSQRLCFTSVICATLGTMPDATNNIIVILLLLHEHYSICYC